MAFANILAWTAVYDLSQPRFLEVNFFDVGQGDAIFIETPRRQQILIDGGPDSTILEKLGKEMSFWDRTIDLVILTHPESDHLNGPLEVLKRYKIDYILWTGIVRDTAEYKEWQRLLKEESEKDGARIKIAKSGQKIKLWRSDLHNIYLEVLYPLENRENQQLKDSNNSSIVCRLTFNQNSFLFTGDIYKSAEKELVIRENSCSNSCEFASLDSDVLKVAHHGSKTSSSKEFIEAVSPEIAVISVKKDNSYGHPHPEVLENLNDINILRTDINGDIIIISDGTRYRIMNNELIMRSEI